MIVPHFDVPVKIDSEMLDRNVYSPPTPTIDRERLLQCMTAAVKILYPDKKLTVRFVDIAPDGEGVQS